MDRLGKRHAWPSGRLHKEGSIQRAWPVQSAGFDVPDTLDRSCKHPRFRLLRQSIRAWAWLMAIQPIRLDRLLKFENITNPDGSPSQDYQTKWQRVMENIEASVNAVIDAQNAADAATAAAATANAAAGAANTAATTAAGAAATANTAATAASSASALATSGTSGLTITATDIGASVTITISAHTRVYGDGTSVAVTGGTVTGLAYSTVYYIYYDQPSRAGGAVTYLSTTTQATAAQTADRHSLGAVTTPAAAAPPATGRPNLPPGVVEP